MIIKIWGTVDKWILYSWQCLLQPCTAWPQMQASSIDQSGLHDDRICLQPIVHRRHSVHPVALQVFILEHMDGIAIFSQPKALTHLIHLELQHPGRIQCMLSHCTSCVHQNIIASLTVWSLGGKAPRVGDHDHEREGAAEVASQSGEVVVHSELELEDSL